MKLELLTKLPDDLPLDLGRRITLRAWEQAALDKAQQRKGEITGRYRFESHDHTQHSSQENLETEPKWKNTDPPEPGFYIANFSGFDDVVRYWDHKGWRDDCTSITVKDIREWDRIKASPVCVPDSHKRDIRWLRRVSNEEIALVTGQSNSDEAPKVEQPEEIGWYVVREDLIGNPISVRHWDSTAWSGSVYLRSDHVHKMTTWLQAMSDRRDSSFVVSWLRRFTREEFSKLNLPELLSVAEPKATDHSWCSDNPPKPNTWYIASKQRDEKMARFWDGEYWSAPVAIRNDRFKAWIDTKGRRASPTKKKVEWLRELGKDEIVPMFQGHADVMRLWSPGMMWCAEKPTKRGWYVTGTNESDEVLTVRHWDENQTWSDSVWVDNVKGLTSWLDAKGHRMSKDFKCKWLREFTAKEIQATIQKSIQAILQKGQR